jgi:protein required for attachment to host cells
VRLTGINAAQQIFPMLDDKESFTRNKKMDQSIYVVVADRGVARIFSTSFKMDTLDLVIEEANPSGRKLRSDVESDRPGRTSNSSGHIHALGNEYSAERHDDEQFAKHICELLGKEHQQKKFSELMIAAPPHFLGALRHHLDASCRKALSATVDKDLLHADNADIVGHFRLR